jgi:hypothetical protein
MTGTSPSDHCDWRHRKAFKRRDRTLSTFQEPAIAQDHTTPDSDRLLVGTLTRHSYSRAVSNTTSRTRRFLAASYCTPSPKERYAVLKPGEYFDLAMEYAQREMTYASDALNAFSGILSVLSDCSHQKFLWAHMMSVFERQLYWVGKAKMRSSLQDQFFPTWSWVGWVGERSFRHFHYYEPAVTCFTIGKDTAGRVTGTTDVCSQRTDSNDSLQSHVKSTSTVRRLKPLSMQIRCYLASISSFTRTLQHSTRYPRAAWCSPAVRHATYTIKRAVFLVRGSTTAF